MSRIASPQTVVHCGYLCHVKPACLSLGRPSACLLSSHQAQLFTDDCGVPLSLLFCLKGQSLCLSSGRLTCRALPAGRSLGHCQNTHTSEDAHTELRRIETSTVNICDFVTVLQRQLRPMITFITPVFICRGFYGLVAHFKVVREEKFLPFV